MCVLVLEHHPEQFSCSLSEFLACIALTSNLLFKDCTPSELLCQCHCANQSPTMLYSGLCGVCARPSVLACLHIHERVSSWSCSNDFKSLHINLIAKMPLTRKYVGSYDNVLPTILGYDDLPKCRIIWSLQGSGSCSCRDKHSLNREYYHLHYENKITVCYTYRTQNTQYNLYLLGFLSPRRIALPDSMVGPRPRFFLKIPVNAT